MTEGADANAAQLEAIVERRDRLQAAAVECFEALLASVERDRPSPERAVELWATVRMVGAPRASKRFADACGYTVGLLQHWRKFGPPSSGRVYEGEFPLEPRIGVVPSAQTPSVYVLFAADVAVYIGRTSHARARMKAHWRDPRKRAAGIDRWRIVTCEVAEQNALERDLIARYNPSLNIAGRSVG